MTNVTLRVRLIMVALAVVTLAVVGFVVWDTTRGTASPGATPTSPLPVLSHVAYALLFTEAIIKKTRIDVLAKWPKPPYQTYRSGPDTCYEWWDKPVALYNLCFRNGLLVDKAIE